MSGMVPPSSLQSSLSSLLGKAVRNVDHMDVNREYLVRAVRLDGFILCGRPLVGGFAGEMRRFAPHRITVVSNHGTRNLRTLSTKCALSCRILLSDDLLNTYCRASLGDNNCSLWSGKAAKVTTVAHLGTFVSNHGSRNLRMLPNALSCRILLPIDLVNTYCGASLGDNSCSLWNGKAVKVVTVAHLGVFLPSHGARISRVLSTKCALSCRISLPDDLVNTYCRASLGGQQLLTLET